VQRWDERDCLWVCCPSHIHLHDALGIMAFSSLLLPCVAVYTCTTAGKILAQSFSQLEASIRSSLSPATSMLRIRSRDCLYISVPIKRAIGTKFVVRWADLIYHLALDAVRTITADDAGVHTIDIKRYARRPQRLQPEARAR